MAVLKGNLTVGGQKVSMVFADRLQDIKPFRVMEVLSRARELEAQGRDIVHMEVGEPDFVTAAPIIEAGKKALTEGMTHYTQAVGMPALREAIAAHYQHQYGLDIDPRRIIVTPGASGALLLIAALLINPGDGMLMTDPGYPCNRHFLRLVEGEGQLVPVTAADHYQLSAAKAAEYWQPNTVGALVASPANPTGEILSLEELTKLYKEVQGRGGYLVVDEIYHGLTYGERAHSILEVADDAFVINSFSKYFGMTGWRIGWLVAPEAAISELEKLAQNLFISVSTVAQYAALAAFNAQSREIFEQRKAIFCQRRDFLLPRLQELGFGIPHAPAGAFYLYASINHFSDASQAFCLEMLERHGIAITPGADFGAFQSDEYVRFAYTTSMQQLEKSIEVMSKAL